MFTVAWRSCAHSSFNRVEGQGFKPRSNNNKKWKLKKVVNSSVTRFSALLQKNKVFGNFIRVSIWHRTKANVFANFCCCLILANIGHIILLSGASPIKVLQRKF